MRYHLCRGPISGAFGLSVVEWLLGLGLASLETIERVDDRLHR